MLFLIIIAVFAFSAMVAVSTTRALLKFMFSALSQHHPEELKPHA